MIFKKVAYWGLLDPKLKQNEAGWENEEGSEQIYMSVCCRYKDSQSQELQTRQPIASQSTVCESVFVCTHVCVYMIIRESPCLCTKED